jgi:hypothetical protein
MGGVDLHWTFPKAPTVPPQEEGLRCRWLLRSTEPLTAFGKVEAIPLPPPPGGARQPVWLRDPQPGSAETLEVRTSSMPSTWSGTLWWSWACNIGYAAFLDQNKLIQTAERLHAFRFAAGAAFGRAAPTLSCVNGSAWLSDSSDDRVCRPGQHGSAFVVVPNLILRQSAVATAIPRAAYTNMAPIPTGTPTVNAKLTASHTQTT